MFRAAWRTAAWSTSALDHVLMHPLDDFREIATPAVPLAPLTWFRMGGPADYLVRPRSEDELMKVVARCVETGLNWRVLGSGSNVLVSEQGVRDAVILLESPAFSDVVVNDTSVRAGAAVPLTALISQIARAGLSGMEVLTGIPGTVGGAVRGNSGTRQGNIANFLCKATVLDPQGRIQVRERDELIVAPGVCQLDAPLLLSAEFALNRDEPEAVVRRMRRLWIVKKEQQPYGHQSSGQIFKNPSGEVSANMLLEQAGLKGAKVGAAEFSERNANFIVAQPGCSSDDVLRLIELARNRVREVFGHDLETQIQFWP